MNSTQNVEEPARLFRQGPFRFNGKIEKISIRYLDEEREIDQ